MKKYILVASIVGITSGNTMAANQEDNPYWLNFSPASFSGSTSLGWLGGKAKETVIAKNSKMVHKLSQLDWKINNAAIIKGDLSWDLLPYLTLTAKGWTTLASGNGHMDDWDWHKPEESHWTNWSGHSNTRLTYANEFDFNLKGWVFTADNFKLGAIAGYQESRFSWAAYGGDYDYSRDGGGIGSWPYEELGIGYKQQFSLPYIGLVGQYRYEDYEVNALFKFSNWVKAKANDVHYQTDRTFVEKGNNSRYYSIALDAGYYVTPNAKVFTELTWSRYSNAQGPAKITQTSTGKDTGNEFEHEIHGKYNTEGGIENTNYSVSLGLKYTF